MRKNSGFQLHKLFSPVSLATACLAYFLLACPLRATHPFDMPYALGIQTFLPFTLGLFLGPNAIGAAAGAALAALVSGVGNELEAECVCIVFCSLGMWLGWFGIHPDGHLRFERGQDLFRYAVLCLTLSVMAGAISQLINGISMVKLMIGYFVCAVLVGLPVNILLSGIFCLEPVLPPWCTRRHDVTVHLENSAALDVVNDSIEEAAMGKKIPRKRIFEVQSCLEELYIRISKTLPGAVISGYLDLGTTISLRLSVPGKRYDPLRFGKNEDDLDAVSLKLIRHRALRASHTYSGGKNEIHIVV